MEKGSLVFRSGEDSDLDPEASQGDQDSAPAENEEGRDQNSSAGEDTGRVNGPKGKESDRNDLQPQSPSGSESPFMQAIEPQPAHVKAESDSSKSNLQDSNSPSTIIRRESFGDRRSRTDSSKEESIDDDDDDFRLALTLKPWDPQ